MKVDFRQVLCRKLELAQVGAFLYPAKGDDVSTTYPRAVFLEAPQVASPVRQRVLPLKSKKDNEGKATQSDRVAFLLGLKASNINPEFHSHMYHPGCVSDDESVHPRPEGGAMARRNIVVVGASAGGIEVLQTILGSLPWDLPASVFVVLHTSEDSPGLLPEILNRCSKLPVIYAVHGAPILPGRVYVAPAGRRHMLLDRGAVRMEPGPRENRNRPSVDALFRSASYAYGSQVIGVVLTGNLDDGSAGVAAIQARGGLAVVQDPEDALAPSMPTSAMDATEIDYVLTAEQIGPKLIELVTSDKAEELRAIPNGGGNLEASGHTYSCPECGGVLEEIQENKLARLRCRVGHIYSPESFLADQTEAVERALWAAIRSMEEQTEYADRLAASSREKQRLALARRFSEKAEGSRENAAILRELLQRTTEEIFDIPEPAAAMEPRTGTD